VQDRALFRPAEVHVHTGDPSKARRKLKWKPEVDFRGLIEMMVNADMALVDGMARVDALRR